MLSQTKRTAYRLFLGALLFSLVAVACNNKKDKKEETIKEDTLKADTTPPPPPMNDTVGMDRDTADTRPVKPGE